MKLTIYPKTKQQIKTVKAFLKALEIPFETVEESPYDPKFVAKIKASEQEMKEGKFTVVKNEELDKFLGIDD